MNKNRRPMPKQMRKALKKEVKKGQKKLGEKEESPTTNSLTPSKMLKKYPKNTQKTERPIVDSLLKEIAIKKKKKSFHHSKRTTPGEVDHRESPPSHIHKEGGVWEKTLVKQNKLQRKIFTSKLQKHKRSKK